MEKRFAENIKTCFPYLVKSRLLIAISGGVDSVVLTHLCQSAGLEIGLAHCNFQLRGEESDGDESFVRELAERLGIRVFVRSFKTREVAGENKSIQVVARTLRYQWFRALMEQENYDYVLTAHHLNDDLETFFINLIRGTGIEGLSGISPQKERVIRPLLDFTRQEIEHFAGQQSLQWREDRSNASHAYLRNRIRHKMVPWLLQEEPDFLERYKLTRSHLQDSVELLEEYTEKLMDEIRFKKNGYDYYKIDAILEKRRPRAVLYRLFQGYGFRAWDDLFDLLTAQSGKFILSPSHRLLKDRKHLILDTKTTSDSSVYYLGKNQKKLSFKEGCLICENVIKVTETAKNIAYLAAEKLTFPLKLRYWQSGDYFQPFGMSGRKKISDFLNDEKIPLFEKEKTRVLVSGKAIVWIVGHRIDDRYKVEKETNRVLKIEYSI